jgi:hypothetical protein
VQANPFRRDTFHAPSVIFHFKIELPPALIDQQPQATCIRLCVLHGIGECFLRNAVHRNFDSCWQCR